MHRSPTRRVFSGTGLQLVTRPATIQYLYQWAVAASHQVSNLRLGGNNGGHEFEIIATWLLCPSRELLIDHKYRSSELVMKLSEATVQTMNDMKKV
ncbi:hypothetical protein TNCV_4021691 [Trichonephila clavipes]|nr:hypothetical protein TNCV_4021691 [Trichonephila clavipes]